MERINKFVRETLQNDENLTCIGGCRNSVSKIRSEINEKYPSAETQILVYPEARTGDGVHYSLLVKENGRESLINTVKAPGFPVYIGEPEKAPPTFQTMKIVREVI